VNLSDRPLRCRGLATRGPVSLHEEPDLLDSHETIFETKKISSQQKNVRLKLDHGDGRFTYPRQCALRASLNAPRPSPFCAHPQLETIAYFIGFESLSLRSRARMGKSIHLGLDWHCISPGTHMSGYPTNQELNCDVI
jgi:hypothetical protein